MLLKGFLIGLTAALLATPLIRWAARRVGVMDAPDAGRKRHAHPTPLLGGIAIFLAFVVGVVATRGDLTGGFLLPKHLAGIVLGALILVVGGAIDDRRSLKPAVQLLFPAAAALTVIASGIGIEYVTNPFGGLINLDLWRIQLFALGGVPYGLSLPGDLLVFVWLMVMMYTTKLLDGLDGLVSGLGVIGAVVVALISLRPEIGQPELARLAMIAAGAMAGFLAFNARPASIFLGEGGSTLVGYLLGTMAILSGAKIGITLLVVAVPFLDVAWTVFRRLVLERKPVSGADLGHLHFRLQELGLSPWGTVLVFWGFAAAFGGVGLFLQHREKTLAFVLLAAVFVLSSFLMRRWKR